MRSTTLLLLLLGNIVGCDGPKLVPVTATIQLDGKPLAHAQVLFTGQGFDPPLTHPPSGITDRNGQVSPRYRDDQPGIPPGTYRIAVLLNAPDPANDNARTGKNLLPAHYASPDTSGLSLIVPESGGSLEPIQLDRRSIRK